MSINNSRLYRLYEARCSCCMSKAELRSRKKDRQIVEDSVRYRNKINVLLLGTPGSGKSTFLRQANMLFGEDLDNDELNEFRHRIYSDVIKGMKVLIDARTKLRLEWQDPSNQMYAEKILNFQAPQYIETDEFRDYFKSLNILWLDKAIQDAFDRREEFQLGEPTEYFLRHLDRVGEPDYLPTKLDALYAKETKGHGGIVNYELDMHGITLNIIDRRDQGYLSHNALVSFLKTLFARVENITTFIFLVSSNSYDQVCMDGTENCLEYACNLFEKIVSFPYFANASFILFFTQTNLLERKIKYSNIKDYFPEFQGDPQKLEDVQNFILQIFDSKRREGSLFHHFTTVSDTENIRFVFALVKDTILQNCLRSLEKT